MEHTETRKLRIRRCKGNRSAWLLCALRADGTESDSFGSYTTSLTIGGLFGQHSGAWHLLRPGVAIELIWEPLP